MDIEIDGMNASQLTTKAVTRISRLKWKDRKMKKGKRYKKHEKRVQVFNELNCGILQHYIRSIAIASNDPLKMELSRIKSGIEAYDYVQAKIIRSNSI